MAQNKVERLPSQVEKIPDSTQSLEQEILADSKEDINFTTKLKSLIEKTTILQEKKKWTKNKQELRQIQDEINSIYREKNRLIRFHKLWKEQNTWVEWLDKEDIDNIGVKKLLTIENNKKWFLASAFAFKQIEDKDWNITEEAISNPDNINEWDTINIDFGKNKWAYWKVGAWDILPTKVQVVKIIDAHWEVRIGKRGISGSKVWYYDLEWRYIPIYNNYKLYIPKSSELNSSEYKDIWITSAFLSDKKQLEELEKTENTAKVNYIQVVEENERLSRISDIVVEIGWEFVNQKNYKDKLRLTLERAKEYKENKIKYSDEELQLVINRLTRTLNIIWNKDFNFDWDKYKASIAKLESWWMYNSRNDDIGRRKWIEWGKWAFGKYQFIGNTLRWYGIDLGNPPEETKIQEWLQNPSLQEEIMDKYMLEILEKNILSNPIIMSQIERKEKSIEYFLALTHIWWPGALNKNGWEDWLWTSTSKYAEQVARYCEI